MSRGRIHGVEWNQIARLVNCLAIAYIMVRPVGFNLVLVPVLGILALSSIVMLTKRRPQISRPLALLVGLLVLTGVYGAIIGAGNPGVLNGVLVWIIAPALFGLWVISGDLQLVRMLLVTCAIATIALALVILIYIASNIGIFPHFFPNWALEQGGFTFDGSAGDAITIRFYGLSTLVASAPLWLTASILPAHPLLPHKALSISAAALAVMATLVSGRAALTIVTLAVPVVVWVVWRLVNWRAPRTIWRRVAPLLFVAGAISTVGLLYAIGNKNVVHALSRAASLFTGEGQGESEAVRSVQADRLLGAWLESPFFGHGLGATIDGYTRSDERAWDFELQYHLYLFQFGIFGVLLLLAAVAAAVCGFVLALRISPQMESILFATAAGAIAMLVANWSNPYLQAPGHMWAIYLPLMVVNIILTQRQIPPAQGSDNGRASSQIEEEILQ